MRTTVTLDDDVAAAVAQLQRQQTAGISSVVNTLIRRGLTAPRPASAFHQHASDMGAPRLPVDDVAGLLEVLEGPDHRA